MTFFSRISRLTVFTGTFNAKLTRFDTLSKLASGLPYLQRTHKTDLDNKNYNNLECFRHLRKFKKKLNHSAIFAHINIHVLSSMELWTRCLQYLNTKKTNTFFQAKNNDWSFSDSVWTRQRKLFSPFWSQISKCVLTSVCVIDVTLHVSFILWHLRHRAKLISSHIYNFLKRNIVRINFGKTITIKIFRDFNHILVKLCSVEKLSSSFLLLIL